MVLGEPIQQIAGLRLFAPTFLARFGWGIRRWVGLIAFFQQPTIAQHFDDVPTQPAGLGRLLNLKVAFEHSRAHTDEREFGVSRKPLREQLLKRLREFRGRLPADFKFDRDEANAR